MVINSLIIEAEKWVELYNKQEIPMNITDFCFKYKISEFDFCKYIDQLKMQKNNKVYQEYLRVSSMLPYVTLLNVDVDNITTSAIVLLVEDYCKLTYDDFSALMWDDKKLRLNFSASQIKKLRDIFSCYLCIKGKYDTTFIERLKAENNVEEQYDVQDETVKAENIVKNVTERLKTSYLSEACNEMGMTASKFKEKYLAIVKKSNQILYKEYLNALHQGEKYRRDEIVKLYRKILEYNDWDTLDDEELYNYVNEVSDSVNIPFVSTKTRGGEKVFQSNVFNSFEIAILFRVSTRYFSYKREISIEELQKKYSDENKSYLAGKPYKKRRRKSVD